MLRLKLTITDFLELERNFRLPILTSFQCRRSYISSDSTISYSFLFLENEHYLLGSYLFLTSHFSLTLVLCCYLSVMIGPINLFEISVFLNNVQGRLLAKNRRSFQNTFLSVTQRGYTKVPSSKAGKGQEALADSPFALVWVERQPGLGHGIRSRDHLLPPQSLSKF